jgi:hypothetical protein
MGKRLLLLRGFSMACVDDATIEIASGAGILRRFE